MSLFLDDCPTGPPEACDPAAAAVLGDSHPVNPPMRIKSP
jgi:hypothetical protein